MMFKNTSGAKRIFVMFYRLLLDAVSGFKSLFGGDGGYFVSVFSLMFLSFSKDIFTVFKRCSEGTSLQNYTLFH